MQENDVLNRMSSGKAQRVRAFLQQYLGHLPTREEKKKFTFMHRLNEVLIYHKKELVGKVQYFTEDETVIA